MVGVSASVNFPLHHKVQKFSSGTDLHGWSRKMAVKWLGCVGGGGSLLILISNVQVMQLIFCKLVFRFLLPHFSLKAGWPSAFEYLSCTTDCIVSC